MTQVKLWQIVSKKPNSLIVSDSDGNLTNLPEGKPGRILQLSPTGVPDWVDNLALATAQDARTQVEYALADAKAYTRDQIATLVDDAPIALNTLKELADKLNGQDGALGGLLAQVETKASARDVYTRTEADSVLAAALLANGASTDQKITGLQAQIAQDIQTAKTDAIRIAGDDATFKVNAGLAVAAADAQHRADGAQQGAISASAIDAQQRADAAQSNAISTIGQQLQSIYGVPTTVTACLVGSAKSHSLADIIANGLSLSGFVDFTGVDLKPGEALNAKLLFINGVGVGADWNQVAANGSLDTTIIRFQPELAKRVFDGEDNAIMILAAVNRTANIIVKPVLI